jgi:hypothetical protein
MLPSAGRGLFELIKTSPFIRTYQSNICISPHWQRLLCVDQAPGPNQKVYLPGSNFWVADYTTDRQKTFVARLDLCFGVS